MEPDRWTGLRGNSSRKHGMSVVGYVAAAVIVAVAGVLLWKAFGTKKEPSNAPESPNSGSLLPATQPPLPTLRPEIPLNKEPSQPPIVTPPVVKAPEKAVTRPTLVDFEAHLSALRANPGMADTLRRALGGAILDETHPLATRRAWSTELAGLTKRLVFSAAPVTGSVVVRVLNGDNLTKIAERVRRDHGANVTPDFIRIVNDLPPNLVRGGTSLKVPIEPMALVIDKSEFRAYLTLGGVAIREWPIGIGRDERTPEGAYKSGKKARNPTWTDPETGKTYRYGEPGHVIGTRWIAFDDTRGRTGFGIHGTNEPDSIGKAMSAGCIRMITADVEELFDLVPSGIDVTIRS